MESQQTSGKSLNEEQLLLLSTRASVERSLAELDPIRAQLEELAKEQASSFPAAVPAVTAVAAAAAAEPTEEKLQKSAQTEPEPPAALLTQVSSGSQCDDWQPPTETKETMTESANLPPSVNTAPSDTSAAVTAAVTRLLQVLHVCAVYPRVTGQHLSPALDYFGKTLLGLTSIAGFTPTLQLSIRSASLYLDESSAESDEIVSGVTYAALGATVSQLVAELSHEPESDTGGSTLVFMAPPDPLFIPVTATPTSPATPAPTTLLPIATQTQTQENNPAVTLLPSTDTASTEQALTAADESTTGVTANGHALPASVDPSTDPSISGTIETETKPRNNFNRRNNKLEYNTTSAYPDGPGRVTGRGRGRSLHSKEKVLGIADGVTAVATSLEAEQQIPQQARSARGRVSGTGTSRVPGRGNRDREGYKQDPRQEHGLEPTQNQEPRERRPRRPGPGHPPADEDDSGQPHQLSHDPVTSTTTTQELAEDGEGWRSTNRPARKEHSLGPAPSQARPRAYNGNNHGATGNGASSSEVVKTTHLAGRGSGPGTQSGTGAHGILASSRQPPRPRTATDYTTATATVQHAH